MLAGRLIGNNRLVLCPECFLRRVSAMPKRAKSRTGLCPALQVTANHRRDTSRRLSTLDRSDCPLRPGFARPVAVFRVIARVQSSINSSIAASGARHKSGTQTARASQYSSKRPLRWQHRRARIALAPRTVQNMPDCFKREPMPLLQPAKHSRADKQMLAPKLWVAHPLSILVEVVGFVAELFKRVFGWSIRSAAASALTLPCAPGRGGPDGS